MSEVKVNKISPRSGTDVTLGDSGDTITIPSGATLANSGTVTGIPASAISSGTIATARLGSGTANSSTFLRGDQTYAEAGGGSLVKLASTTISSGVAAVSFNSTYINSTYDNYRVICYGLSTASDNQDIALRMSVDNGVSFATHVGMFNYSQINGGASTTQYTVGSRSSIPLGSDEEADASGGTNFIIDLMNLNSTTQYKYANGMGTVNNQSNSDYYGYRIHGYIASNTAVNFIKVFTEAGGNLDAGTVTLYGYEK
jgi:hypothetical protein